MRVPITIVICANIIGAPATAAAAAAPTITVYTEPPELEIWVDGEYLGAGDAVLSGPFDDYVEVTVKGKGYKETTEVIDPPTEGGEDVILIITGVPYNFSVLSLILGTLTTFTVVGAFVAIGALSN
ncbi:MAG: hypothetical protein JSW52_03565 [Candidatus Coatesbacteria bacterium]|nr:MAG: hypothetical protein JSW52_03565 [Candidatus Coatesbacteria bacterium]